MHLIIANHGVQLAGYPQLLLNSFVNIGLCVNEGPTLNISISSGMGIRCCSRKNKGQALQKTARKPANPPDRRRARSTAGKPSTLDLCGSFQRSE